MKKKPRNLLDGSVIERNANSRLFSWVRVLSQDDDVPLMRFSMALEGGEGVWARRDGPGTGFRQESLQVSGLLGLNHRLEHLKPAGREKFLKGKIRHFFAKGGVMKKKKGRRMKNEDFSFHLSSSFPPPFFIFFFVLSFFFFILFLFFLSYFVLSFFLSF